MTDDNYDGIIVATRGTLGGRPRITGRRIAVVHVAFWHYHQNMSIKRIAKEFDLTLEQVAAALRYYSDHQDEIDRREEEDQAFVEEMQRRTPSLVMQKLRQAAKRMRGNAP